MKENPIRVMVVDDHAVIRSGLAAFLMAYDDFTLVQEAESGAQAVALCDQAQPDVILMDLLMPGMDGITAIRKIREKCPDIQIIALSSIHENEHVHGALEAGAISYLLKSVSPDELAAAIRAANNGQPTLAPEAARALIQATRKNGAHAPNLTEREHQVLSLMVQGLNNPQIAERLVVSRSTVKFHVSSILTKLGATSRTQAVAIAVEKGYVKK